MPASDGTTGYDFLTLVSWWNLGLLPIALVAATARVYARPIARGLTAKTDARLDGVRIVRIAAWIHIGLMLRASITLAQELLTFREMGVAESFPNLILSLFGVLVNPVIALGFWRRWRAVWWLAIFWYALSSFIVIQAIRWLIEFGGPIDPIWWPAHVVGKALPLFLLVVMFLPRTRRAFAAESRPGNEIGDTERAESPRPKKRTSALRWSLLSLLTLWFLIAVFSNVIVESAEWIDRLVWPPE